MDITRASGALGAGSIPAGGTVYVYALANLINDEIYVGISQNVEQRLLQHNRGTNRYTKPFRPWRVFFTESFSSYSQARKSEKYLKTAAGKKFLRNILRSSGAGSLSGKRRVPSGDRRLAWKECKSDSPHCFHSRFLGCFRALAAAHPTEVITRFYIDNKSEHTHAICSCYRNIFIKPCLPKTLSNAFYNLPKLF